MYGCTVENNTGARAPEVDCFSISIPKHPWRKEPEIMNNTPDQIAGSGTYTTDGNCFIGIIPGRSSVALAGMASGILSPTRLHCGSIPTSPLQKEILKTPKASFYGEVKGRPFREIFMVLRAIFPLLWKG